MTLAAGRRLGPYEIVSAIGAGGMGEVYRARDTKLNRDVAIKVLPDLFANDPDRLARFEREAQVLASLNHPNIAAIYGFEESAGVQALALELVEGPTLADRIAHGPMPLGEVLPIAKQIAEALEAAHEQGIIHRDLKPANVKVREDGAVKVLDFGLAKAMENVPSNTTLSNSPTLSVAATYAGVILGTAAYMSPEQAKGRPVDRRTDIFAFGCVLYEMLTGRRAFDGEDIPEILSRVLQREPDWHRLPGDVPPAITRLLRLCLEKDVKKRRRDAGDVRIDIEQALGGAPDSAVLPVDRRPRRERLAWILAAVFLIAMAALAIPAVMHVRETPPAAPPEMRTEIATPATSDPGSFALSPDGQKLVFVASGDGPSRLWLRPLSATVSQPLAGTEGASWPFWSPDSRSVGFFADGRLKRLDLGGGGPQTLANTATGRGGTWNADGVIVFARNTLGPLFRVAASGGDALAVTKLDKQASHRFPHFLPDGQHFLFYAQGTPETGGIYLGSFDSGDTTRLTVADTAGVYDASSGWLLWVRAGTLVAQRLDLERRALAGDPVTVATPVAFDTTTVAGAVSISASATGLVAYRPGGSNWRQLRWFERAGKAQGAFGAPDEAGMTFPRVSPDGHRVAVSRTVQGNTDIWLLDGTRTSRFTFDAALDRTPIWSPDGSRIVFDSNRKGVRNLYVKPSSGAGSEELLLESPQDNYLPDWSADGRFLLYLSLDPQTGRDLWVLPLEGERKPWMFLKTNFEERQGQFSPDGRWVAYSSNESGRPEIYVRPFVGSAAPTAPDGATAHRAGGQWQVSTAGGIYPRWRPDGKELYYLGPDGQMMAAPIVATGTTFDPGALEALFDTRIVGGGVESAQGWQYDVSRDGRFLINTVLDDAAAQITLIQNWKPPAK